MNAFGLVAAAVDEIRAYWARTVLSIFSVVVGITSVTLIVATGEVGRAAAVTMLERQSGRSATLSVGLNVPTWSQLDAYAVANLLGETAQQSGAIASSVVVSDGGWVAARGIERPATVVGTDSRFAGIRRIRMVDGRWIRATDESGLSPAIVVNKPLAADLGLSLSDPDSLGMTLAIGQKVAVRNIGIVDDGQSTSVAYVPLGAYRSWTLKPATPGLLVWVPPTHSASVVKRLAQMADRLDVRIEAQRIDDPEAVDEFIRIIQAVLAAIAALSLVSGGIGIINLGLVTSGQRSREFAIRRAFGATRSDVFTMVCIESGLTVIAAGAIGVALALAGTMAIAWLASSAIGVVEAPPIPWPAGAIGLLVSVALALVAGIIPARAATGKSIIRAIRE